MLSLPLCTQPLTSLARMLPPLLDQARQAQPTPLVSPKLRSPRICWCAITSAPSLPMRCLCHCLLNAGDELRRPGGWRSSRSCSVPKACLTGKPRKRSVHGLTGHRRRGWLSLTPALIAVSWGSFAPVSSSSIPNRCSSLRCWVSVRRTAMIHLDFARLPCPVRQCRTRAKGAPRSLTPQGQAEHEALMVRREEQHTDAFRAERAGMEGTMSQGVRAFGLRTTRYRRLVQTQLQQVAIAAAINLSRLANGGQAILRAPTRCSAVAALAPSA